MKKIIGFVGAFGLASPGLAADTYFGLTAEIGGGYDSNPYLREGSGGSATVNGSLSPTIQFVTPTSTTALSGYVARTEYLQHNRNPAKSYSVDLNHTQSFSPRLTWTGGIGFSDTTTSLLDPIDQDIATSSDRSRRLYHGQGSFTWKQDALSTWTLSGFANKAEYGNGGSSTVDRLLRDYTTYGGAIGYSRVVSERTSLGVTVNGSRINSKSYPDTTSIQPQLTITHQFSSIWTLNAGVGAIFQKTSFNGDSHKSTNLGFNFDMCGTYPQQTLCFSGSRDTQPSGFGGARTRTNIGLTYSRQLSERSSITASGNYLKDKSPAFFNQFAQSIDYQNATVRYSHDLTERLSAGVQGDYRRRHIRGEGTGDSVGGLVFLSMKFGHLKQ
jgi:hypothetical protein